MKNGIYSPKELGYSLNEGSNNVSMALRKLREHGFIVRSFEDGKFGTKHYSLHYRLTERAIKIIPYLDIETIKAFEKLYFARE